MIRVIRKISVCTNNGYSAQAIEMRGAQLNLARQLLIQQQSSLVYRKSLRFLITMLRLECYLLDLLNPASYSVRTVADCE